jgi:hypothetical protein
MIAERLRARARLAVRLDCLKGAIMAGQRI